jgi:hypothetical protein
LQQQRNCFTSAAAAKPIKVSHAVIKKSASLDTLFGFAEMLTG